MAKTLLNSVNEVLKAADLIAGDAEALTSLTDSARQNWIDKIIQSWNELIQELYDVCELPLPHGYGEDTITLVTGTRAYALSSSLLRLYWPLLDETNGRLIEEYAGGYLELVNDQLVPANYTGLATYGVIRPTDGYLYLDRIPTAAENGLVYKYRYDKTLLMSSASDTVPFNDDVWTAMVPGVTEYFRSKTSRDPDAASAKMNLGRAPRLLRAEPPRSSYLNGNSLSAARGTPGGPTWDNPFP